MAKCKRRALYVTHIWPGFDLYLCEGHAAYLAAKGHLRTANTTVNSLIITNALEQRMCDMEGQIRDLIIINRG